MKGYVYIISNKAMPGLFKVGYTMKDPQLRARELSSTGVPYNFFVEYEILVENPFEVEQRTHEFLRNRCEGKEWFRCNFSECVSAIKNSCSRKIFYENKYGDEEIEYEKKDKTNQINSTSLTLQREKQDANNSKCYETCSKIIIECPRCGQKLRIPNSIRIRLTCSNCACEYEYPFLK